MEEVHEMTDLHHWVRALALDAKRVSFFLFLLRIERILTESLKYRTEVITTANQNKEKYCKKPMRTQS